MALAGASSNPSGLWAYAAAWQAAQADLRIMAQAAAAAGTIKITNFTTTGPKATEVQNDLRLIQAELPNDPDCNKYLTNNQLVIDQLLGNTGGSVLVGVGQFNPNSVNAVAGVGGTNLPPGSAGITVNVNGAYFNSSASTGVQGIAPKNALSKMHVIGITA